MLKTYQLILISVAIPFLYIQDNLKENRYLQNNSAKIFQQNIWENVTYPSDNQNTSENKPKEIKSLSTNTKQPQKILRIGYIGHTFRQHSVDFLARWLYCYHNKEQFEIFTYMINQKEDKITDNWFKYNSKYAYNLPNDIQLIADQISKDQIDILVDLDSRTFDVTCHVMALKQAPIQVTWLGFDASGIPIVTKVGQQWAARNSYAFMMNAGITEGIAWSDEEYIDWGIRLGKDENLRAKIAWKLKQSKKTAPLWNAKQFTLEMEKAYRQMWEIYVNQEKEK